MSARLTPTDAPRVMPVAEINTTPHPELASFTRELMNGILPLHPADSALIPLGPSEEYLRKYFYAAGPLPPEVEKRLIPTQYA